ncbi:u3 small nucleolar RNA-associated protein 11 [Leucogyrophana mollusca]|uniref:U3 small nucleolar RNA-associated protein 11 n=1 Tax=Leucogyrophana mollusca TaxID=85980 RepID=A0ACB8BZ18_9AGAM|nr:u3 small nucleolar RNA-associated protein 11 [Leucogyrophana mollusca]
MTSSLRNSLHRRNHKERSQLAHRARFGILEKHKDYVLRARDYHSKQDRITRLRQKAADRNKDEFYFGMNKERTVEGVHVKDRGNVAMPVDIVKLLKTQDEGYVRTMRAVGLKKIDKLKGQLTTLANLISPDDESLEDGEDALEEGDLETLREAGIISPSTPRKRNRTRNHVRPRHVLFVEDGEDAQQHAHRHSSGKKVDETVLSEGHANLDLGWKSEAEKKSRKLRGKALAQSTDEATGIAEENKLLALLHRKKLLKELAARLTRDTQLRYAQRELEMQRLLMGKGGRRKLRGVEEVGADRDNEDEDEDIPPRRVKADEKAYKPRVYKWRIERKR